MGTPTDSAFATAVDLLEAPPSVDLGAAIGFDGFIDSIFHIARSPHGGTASPLFAGVSDFGRYLLESPGQNSSFPLRSVARSVGGNMPIMVNALSRLGASVTGVGMVGYPALDEIFGPMSQNSRLIGFADPVETIALEFDDGKILLADAQELDALDWPTVRDRVGIDNLTSAFADRRLIGLVNWSEIERATQIWRGLLDEVIRPNSSVRPLIVVDLADCSRKTSEQTLELIELLRDFSTVGSVALILNEGEAQHVHRRIGGTPNADLRTVGAELFASLGVAQVVVRNAWVASAWDAHGWAEIPTIHTDTPLVSTGAGDNFNAGYALGQLLGQSLHLSLVLGVAVAGYYVREGASPDRDELAGFIRSITARGTADLEPHEVATW